MAEIKRRRRSDGARVVVEGTDGYKSPSLAPTIAADGWHRLSLFFVAAHDRRPPAQPLTASRAFN
jgi:hypothetical protein